ncbi:L,D-transpeptidase [Streptomyces sp. NPDC126514]|uniref:L,D-transpeptidase n=1 Tax=Streptomyces sp. NPDC126514 TaxID=3155210 RepID=UPI003316798C
MPALSVDSSLRQEVGMPTCALWKRGIWPVSAGVLLMASALYPQREAPAPAVHRNDDKMAGQTADAYSGAASRVAAVASPRARVHLRPPLSATARPPGAQVLTVRFGPRAGTYGVGQPLTVRLSHPVTPGNRQARAAVEQGLEVTSAPEVGGSWYWVDDQTLHFRPQSFWPAHATITAHTSLDGVKITDTLYGGESEALRITTGDRIEAVTDIAQFSMTVYRNGHAVKTIPVTTGKDGYRTRTGIKVVLEKQPVIRMSGETIGIPKDSPDAYDLNVRHAIRVTWSGEYLHAAPWSSHFHGVKNVSHGCTGMSTGNAAWLYNTLNPGDLVRVIDGPGPQVTAFGNGYGDWNLSWPQWRAGSALAPQPEQPSAPATPSLHPLI